MKHVTQIFSRKALSIICALAIMLSCVSVGFSALAETPSAAAQYVVDADKSPAIPMFAGTKIDLNNVSVLFKDDEAATAGADITWTLGGDYGQNLILGDDNSLTAFLKGNEYKITATAGEKEAILWVVVANEGDSSWDIYTFDFDEYAAEKQLDKLTFEADGGYRTSDYKYNNNGVYDKGIYRTGEFKYDGVAFDQDNVPDAVKPIDGWSAWYRGYMNRNQNGTSNYIKVPFLMPYKHSGTTGDLWLNREVSSGVMPFDNPYMTGALGLSNDDQLIHSVSNGLAQMKGFYVLDNEVVNSFMDYTVTADMDMTSSHGYNGIFSATGYNGVFGRLQTDAAGNPSTAVLQNYTSSNYININWGGTFAETTARTDIANVLFGVNIYAPTAGNQYHRGASVGKIEVNKNAYYTIVTDVAGCDAKDYIGEKYNLTNSGGASISVDNWDYIKSKKYVSEGKSTADVNVVMSVKYAGSTATVFSPVDTTESFAFNNVPELKGNVGVWAGNITVSNSKGEIPTSTGSWINLHSFKVSLNNDITADNDGSEFPVYEKYYFQPVVDATISESYTDLAKSEIYFSNLTDAIDYLDGKGGKVWIKGMYEGAGAAFEGTIENRAPIILSGYKDSATTVVGEETINNGILNNEATTSALNWAKGDITFQYMYIETNQAGNGSGGIDSGRVNYSFGSGGYTFTFGYGLQTIANKAMEDIFVGVHPTATAKDSNYNIYSGTYSSVAPFNTISNNACTMNINSTINVYGGTIRSMSVGSYTNSGSKPMYFTINGDVNYNIYGGTVGTLNLAAQGYRSDIRVTGNIIVRISGGTVTNAILNNLSQHYSNSVHTTANYTTPVRGNMALIVDASRTSRAILGNAGTKSDFSDFVLAENKYYIGIINNYTGSNCYFNTATYGDGTSVLNRFDYKITVKNGEAQPVFVRTDANDPSTSYLQGFTIVPNEAGKIPAINGVKLEPTGKKTAEGLDLYDLSAYKSSREDSSDDATITAITFIDERTPVVSTDDAFTPDAELYTKVATIDEAIASLGAEGGTIYIKGAYTITNMQTEFALSKSVKEGKKLVIAGFGDTAEGNTLNFGTASSYVNLAAAWMYCDVTFENLTMVRSKQAEGTGFNSNGYVLTLGDGLEASVTNFTIGQVVAGKTNNIVVNSGNWNHLISTCLNTSQFGTAGTNVNYVLNGGYYSLGGDSAGANFVGGYDNGNHGKNEAGSMVGKSSYINGDITWTINQGVEFENIKLRTTGRGYAAFACYGTLSVNVNGGNLQQVEMHPGRENSTNSVDGTIVPRYNNMVVTVDARYTKTFINSQLTSIDKTAENNGKKYIAIGNYATEDIIANVAYGLDYAVQVYGGEAHAVFNGTGADAVFAGFTITPDAENAGKLVVVNGTDVIEAVDGLYDLSAYEDKGLIKIEFKVAEELEDTQEVVTDSSVIAEYINGKVPVKEGYLFGGFIGEDGKALKADEIANAESLTVKFIPKAVLDIGWQIRQNGDKVDLRLISTVDSLEYSAVTFIVKVAGRDDMVLTSKKVYTSIAGYEDGENVQYAPTAFSAASEYFMTHVITGIPAGFHGTDFTVTANLLTKDGKTITGDAIEFQIKDHADYTAIVE